MDSANKKFLSGYDRHSLGAIIASPEEIEKYKFANYKEFPDANIVRGEKIDLKSGNAREILREVRSKEGISLIEIVNDDIYLVKNGLILPTPREKTLLDAYGVSNYEELSEKTTLGKDLGGKTLALLNMSIHFPEIAFLRVDGTKYLLKGGYRHNIESRMVRPNFSHSHKYNVLSAI